MNLKMLHFNRLPKIKSKVEMRSKLVLKLRKLEITKLKYSAKPKIKILLSIQKQEQERLLSQHYSSTITYINSSAKIKEKKSFSQPIRRNQSFSNCKNSNKELRMPKNFLKIIPNCFQRIMTIDKSFNLISKIFK